MNHSNDFFQALAQILHKGETATLSATTTCEHVASVSVKAGEIQAIRYSLSVGPEALLAFQSLEVKSFSCKSSSSNLFYKPAESPVSTQDLVDALNHRMVLPADLPPVAESPSEPKPAAAQLSYRGKPVEQVAPGSAAPGGSSQPSQAHQIQYRGSGSNPFLRRRKS